MAHKDANTYLATNEAYARGQQGPITDLTNSGQMGYTVDIRYFHGAADYTRRPVIAFLMEAPAGFQDLENPDKWVACLKALIELHPRTISGLDQTLEIDYAENPFGGAGEIMQTLAKVKRARSAPQFEWVEKIGMPIKNFWRGYILNLLGNPDTNVPEVVARGRSTPYGLYPDYISFTVMFVEPDPTQKFAVEAWLCTNMMPMQGPRIEGGRDITATPESVTHSMTFTCIQQVGSGVLKLAQEMLDQANQTGIQPSLREAWLQNVETDVTAVESYTENAGYVQNMNNNKNQSISV